MLSSHQPAEALAMGERWARAGHDVTVVLLDGAVAVVRPGHVVGDQVRSARAAGVRVVADATAVHERVLDIATSGTVDLVDLDEVAAMIGDTGTRVQWW